MAVFLIGLLMALFISKGYLSTQLSLFLITGLLGSLTTFSTFGYETMELLLKEELPGLAFLNVACNLVLGFTAVWLGQLAVRLFA